MQRGRQCAADADRRSRGVSTGAPLLGGGAWRGETPSAAARAVTRELLAGVGVAFFRADDAAALAHQISQLERAPDARRVFGLAERPRAGSVGIAHVTARSCTRR